MVETLNDLYFSYFALTQMTNFLEDTAQRKFLASVKKKMFGPSMVEGHRIVVHTHLGRIWKFGEDRRHGYLSLNLFLFLSLIMFSLEGTLIKRENPPPAICY